MLPAIAPLSSQIFFTSITTLNLNRSLLLYRCNILGIIPNVNPFALHLLLSLKTIHLVPVWIRMKATFCVLCFFFFFFVHVSALGEIIESSGGPHHFSTILLKNFHLFKITKSIINFYFKKFSNKQF